MMDTMSVLPPFEAVGVLEHAKLYKKDVKTQLLSREESGKRGFLCVTIAEGMKK